MNRREMIAGSLALAICPRAIEKRGLHTPICDGIAVMPKSTSIKTVVWAPRQSGGWLVGVFWSNGAVAVSELTERHNLSPFHPRWTWWEVADRLLTAELSGELLSYRVIR
jgi:hypothetical protein